MASDPGHPVRVSDLVDGATRTTGRRTIIALCGIAVAIDGADFQIIGFVAPALMRDLRIAPAAMGMVFSAGIVGMMLGSLVIAPLADRYGRRPLLIGSLAIFALSMLTTAVAADVWQLGALRLLTGVGLGAVMPIATSLTGEYSPTTRRMSAMVAVSTCFPLGAVAGGLVAVQLIPTFGWQAVFLVGGFLPAALALAILALLPESLEFLAGRKRHSDIAAIARQRLGADVAPSATFIASDPPGRPSVRRLFESGRARGTMLLWSTYALNLLLLMFLSSWLPTLLLSSGRSAREAILVGTVLQVGGVAGGLGLGRLVRRSAAPTVLSVAFAVAAASLLLVGLPAVPLGAVFALVALCGMTIVGGQQVLNGLAAHLYPGDLRATGAGWAMGMGRLGSVAGPAIAGGLLAAHVGYGPMLQLAAAPALAAAALMLFLARMKRENQ